eukprot:g26691.t1
MADSKRTKFSRRRFRLGHLLATCSLVALHGHAAPVWAHEGHAALPSNGASVVGDQLLLSDAAIKAVDVKTHTVSIGSIQQRLRVNAHVELPPLRRGKVATLLAGRVRAVHVKPGDLVTQGQLLASIESLELESLQVDLLQVSTELELLAKRALQQKELARTGGIRGDVYLATESQHRKKRAEFEIFKRKLAGWGLKTGQIAKLLQSGETVGSVALTSPMAGVVEHVNARTGQLVQSTDHLIDIVNRSTVYIVGEVLESDAHLVQPGNAVDVTFSGLPGRTFPGKIHHQHLHLHLPQRAIHVVVPMTNSDGDLRPGMFGRMTITVAEAKNEIVCPTSVLIENGHRSFVLRRDDVGKFNLQPVTIGMRSRNQVVITSGLFPGQEVISRGTHLLASMFDRHEMMQASASSPALAKTRSKSTDSTLSASKRLRAARAVVEIPVGKRAIATSLIEGWVAEIPDDPKNPFHEGAYVRKGQVLARVRSQELRNMQLKLLQANAGLAWTQDEVKRLKPVAKSGGVASKDLWQREAELKMLRTQIKSLKRQLSMIGLSQTHLDALLKFDLTRPSKSGMGTAADPIVDTVEIRAPISGQIAKISIAPGELVHAHDKMFEIQNISDVWVKAYYFEQDAPRLDVDQKAVVTFPSNPGLRLQGKVVLETLVTFPIESAMNGATGVKRVRSASGIGISIVYVEFDWGTDIYKARQIVSEKLQLVRAQLPTETNAVMTPISSIMGEIMLIGVTPKEGADGLQARTTADWIIRRRLLSVSGVSQVTVMGGELKQYQVLTSPERLSQYGVTIDELTNAVEKSNAVSGGGFLLDKEQEKLIRIVGRVGSKKDIENTIIRMGETVPITIGQVAEVKFAGPVKRGDGSVNANSAVILSVQKQPGADTIALTERILKTLDEIQKQQPNIKIETNIFRQANFIEVAIGNVEEAIRDGAIWVVVVLFIFLWNIRTSTITLTAIPLSILMTALIFRYFGISINTMTLGGLAVAVGELVDDSIVDIENIYRRLKENRQREIPENPLKVVFRASAEVRNSIVYATLIVVLVVFPLFSLAGLEGRMFAPLGLSYLLTLVCSLFVSLTVTPVLASYLLPNARFMESEKDPFLLRWLKWADTYLLRFVLKHSTAVLVSVALLVGASVGSIFYMGGEFLPEFNEGTLTIGMTLPAGTNLEESNRLARQAELLMLEVPEVTHVARRTGRAELDEHAENVNFSEMDVGLREPEEPLPGWHRSILRAVPGLHRFGVKRVGRPREEVLADIREKLGAFPRKAEFNIGQPISHRLDHIMSGIRAQVAVKIFGEDLAVLRSQAEEVRKIMETIPGVVDLKIEQQVEIKQIRVTPHRDKAKQHGLTPEEVVEALETAFQGRTVSQVLEGQRTFDLVVWFDAKSRNDIDAIRNTELTSTQGGRVKLGELAQVEERKGPNTINRENVMRRIVVQCNTADRDLAGVVGDIKNAVQTEMIDSGRLPEGYFIDYGGQFEAQQQANLRLLILGSFSIAGIFLLLIKCLGSWRAAAQVMVNIPLAAIGSVIALLIVTEPNPEKLAAASWWEHPQIWLESTTLSVAHWVGFITLIGIVSRNGIMMISHYIHLIKYEGEEFSEKMIIRGSLERLAPVLMTALTTTIGLVPLALGGGQTGKEILHPLAIVVIGGLLSSTLLDQIVTPALFWKFGRKVAEKQGKADGTSDYEDDNLLRMASQFDDRKTPPAKDAEQK